VLAHDREQIAQQRALLVGELLGDGIDRSDRARAVDGPDPRVPAPILRGAGRAGARVL
jgi:hypothetical protein